MSESASSERTEAQLPSFLTRILLRRKRWIILGTLLGVAAAVAFHQLSGPWFEATAQLLVLKKKLDTQPISGPAAPGQPQDDYLPTHMLIISSPRVIREAVVTGDLLSLEGLQRQGALSKAVKSVTGNLFASGSKRPPEWQLADSIVDALKVSSDTPKPGLGVSHEVINIAFNGRESKDCVRVLDAIVSSYHNFLKDTYKSGNVETLELIDRAREVLQKDLNTKEAAYREFRRKTPMLWKGKDGNGTTVHQDRLFNVDAQRSALRMRSAEIQSTLVAIESALKDGRSYLEILPIVSGVPGNREVMTGSQVPSARVKAEPWNVGRPARETLEEQLINLRLEEQGMLKSGLGPAHPDVRALRDRIASVLGMISPSSSAQGRGQDQQAWVEELVKLKVRLLKQELSDNERTDHSLAALFEHDQSEAKESILHEIEDGSHRADIERSKLLYESIIKRLQEIDSVKEYGGFNMHVLEPPQSKLHIKKYLLAVATALFLGLLAGFGGGCLVERRDKSFHTPQEVCYRLGLPVLGHVPHVAARRVLLHRAGSKDMHAAEAEALRAVRTALFFGNNAARYRVIQITSPYAGDGKTTLAANLGFSIAQSGKKVLLVDADLRRPQLHSAFGLADDVGLTSLLADQADLTEAILETEVPGLSLLPSGPCPPNPAELLSSPRLKELLEALRMRFDYILIDTPPVMAVTDPCVVAHAVDGVVLTLRNSKQGRPHAQGAREVLDRTGANVLGVVVNGVTHRFAFAGYGDSGISGRVVAPKVQANRS